MKILFVQPTADKQGHYGKYTLNLCQELARLGNEVILFTNKVDPVKFLKERPLFKIIEYKDGAFSFEKYDAAKKSKPWLYLWGYYRNSFVIFKAALAFAKKEKPDVIQVTDVEFGTMAILLKVFGRGLPPVALLIHAPNFAFFKYPGSIFKKLYKVVQREILRMTFTREIKAIVTLGEYHKEQLQKQFRLSYSNVLKNIRIRKRNAHRRSELQLAFPVQVIYDGAEPPAVFLSTGEARQKLGIDYAGTVFLLFGVLRKDKGLEYLLEAAKILSDSGGWSEVMTNPLTPRAPNKKSAFLYQIKETSQNERNSFVTVSLSANQASHLDFISIIAKQESLSRDAEMDRFKRRSRWSGWDSNPHFLGEKLDGLPINLPPRFGTAPKFYHKYKNEDKKSQDFKILIAGSPFDYEPREVSEMVMRLGLEDRVILRLGYVPDEEIPLYFFAADCVVFPYRKIYTGGTGPLLKEAAMYKKPVIVSRVSEMGYLVAKRNMGLLAEPENAESLAEKLKEFLQSSAEQRRQWGENAFNAANTWKKMARQYLGLYKTLNSKL